MIRTGHAADLFRVGTEGGGLSSQSSGLPGLNYFEIITLLLSEATLLHSQAGTTAFVFCIAISPLRSLP